MACLAPGGRSIRTHFQHTLVELPFVWILVATGAAEILPMIDFCGLRFEFRRLFVTVATRHRDMPAG